ATAYTAATALVYPSRYEGFGLPILEAFACGCPVITCRNSSIPEVADDAVIYIPENDTQAMIGALNKVREPSVRDELAQRGFIQAKKFSWAKMADEVKSVLLKTIAEHPGNES